MPNAYTVYMHDTPNRNLFDQEVRAFSHGCIRTGDALGYAAALLEGMATRPQIDAIVASGETATVDLGRPMPVYVAYFTAVGDGAFGARILPDIYSRDK
jgi:murein L,D-transpeptidase YcbB/YkuD